jgi:hypothetical protein
VEVVVVAFGLVVVVFGTVVVVVVGSGTDTVVVGPGIVTCAGTSVAAAEVANRGAAESAATVKKAANRRPDESNNINLLRFDRGARMPAAYCPWRERYQR